MFPIPWRSPFLAWLEELQTLTGLRDFGSGIEGAYAYIQLRRLHHTGATVQDAAAWLTDYRNRLRINPHAR